MEPDARPTADNSLNLLVYGQVKAASAIRIRCRLHQGWFGFIDFIRLLGGCVIGAFLCLICISAVVSLATISHLISRVIPGHEHRHYVNPFY